MERLFPDIDPAIISELTATEQVMQAYAEKALQNSVVSVSIENCKHPLMQLPKLLAESMDELPTPPTAITGVSLGINYDRQAFRFTTLFAGLHLDNNYSLIFRRLQSRLPGQSGQLYFGALLNPAGGVEKKTDQTHLMPEEHVSNILTSVGIGVPTSPREASWDEIRAMLQFAGRWTARTTRSTPLDLVRTLAVEDRVEGSSMDSGTSTLDGGDGTRSRRITVCFDEAKQASGVASTSWKLVAESRNQHETPCIVQLSRVPLEFRLPEIEDGIELLGELPSVRHELTDQAQDLPLSPVYLRAAQDAIAAAMSL